MALDPKSPTGLKLSRAAVAVFEERGYHAARVSDIAEAAGVAKGTFYLYFTSKEAVFSHLIDDFFGRLMGATLGQFPASEVGGREDLVRQSRAMWRTLLESCRAEPVLSRLVLREAPSIGAEARARVEGHFTAAADAIGAYFDVLSARGVLRAGLGAASAWAVLGMIERAIHYAVSVAPEADAGALAEEFLALELGGQFGPAGVIETGPG